MGVARGELWDPQSTDKFYRGWNSGTLYYDTQKSTVSKGKGEITIFEIAITNHLSISEHVREIITKCAQSLHALKILRYDTMRYGRLTCARKLTGWPA